MRNALAVCALAVLWAVPCSVPAQGLDCNYVRCALRIERGFWHTRVVAGDEGRQVARVGFFGTSLHERLSLPDTALLHVRAANARFRRGAVFAILGLVSLGIGAAAHDESTGRVAIPASFAFALVGGITVQQGLNELSRAIWWYNRQFAR